MQAEAEAKFLSFGATFLDAFETIETANAEVRPILDPRRLSITMITFVAQLSEPIPPQVLRTVLQEISEGGGYFVAANDKSLVDGAKAIMLRDTHTAATTQLFHSGQVQIAGCASHIEFAAAIEELIDLLRQYPGLEDIELNTFDTQLINSNAGLGKRVKIGDLTGGKKFVDLLNDALHPLEERRRAEKRENYAPITIVQPSAREGCKVTCQLFATGSLQISGPLPQDIGNTYAFILRFLHHHRSLVLVEHDGKDRTEETRKNFRCWTHLVQSLPCLCHSHLPVRRLVQGCQYCELFGNTFFA